MSSPAPPSCQRSLRVSPSASATRLTPTRSDPRQRSERRFRDSNAHSSSILNGREAEEHLRVRRRNFGVWKPSDFHPPESAPPTRPQRDASGHLLRHILIHTTVRRVPREPPGSASGSSTCPRASDSVRAPSRVLLRSVFSSSWLLLISSTIGMLFAGRSTVAH